MSESETVQVLRTGSTGCGRRVTDREIFDTVRTAFRSTWTPAQRDRFQPAVPPTWPAVNQEQQSAILRDGGGLADLWEASPWRLHDNEQHAEDLIDRLFPGNPLLCCGRDNYDFETKPREDWRGTLASLQFIVPSPMTERTGITQDGKESAHCLNNTGPRRFLVIEFDEGTPDEHSTILLHLAAHAPLALAVHSGGKSLHGWFYCAGHPEDKLRRFMRHTVSLGADRATWTRSQFVRMPDGTRNNGKRQTVFFFNPEVIR